MAGIHPVREALLAGRPLDCIMIARGAGGTKVQDIVNLARERSIPVRFETKDSIEHHSRGSAHQGVVAIGAAHRYSEIDEVAETARLLVVLDGVEDPHNLGAIIRTAHAAGAEAVVIPERRAVGLTETAIKASAGAIEYTPVARVVNINRTLEDLKKRGFWIYGLDERGEQSYSEIDYAVPTVFVVGAEGHGLHQIVKAHCDALVRIPMSGEIASLNVSVATGIVLFDWRNRVAAKGA